MSSYHFVTGVDTSSSASIAAYINSLTYSLESHPKWFSLNQSNSWNISKCTFCAFNAFAGMDVRVEARIPGGVKSFVVDVMGAKKGTDSEGWQETFLSSILRSLRSSDFDDNCALFMKSKRALDGLFSPQIEMKFLESATKLFHKGRLLGSPAGPHLAGNHDNFLTLGVVGYFCSTGRPEISIGFLKPFVEKDSQLQGLMMSCLLQSSTSKTVVSILTNICVLDKQGLALKMITEGETATYGQLADFLMSRGDFAKAECFATECLKSFPTDFANWHRLIKIKIALKQPEKALVILNNAPMSAYPESDFFKALPKPVLISLPGTSQTENEPANSSALTILEKLKSQNLRGTFKRAYELLVEIYQTLGWDGLLECRSKVFVMEKEYLTEGDIRVTSEDDGNSKTTVEVISESQLKSPLNEPLSFPPLPSPHFLRSTGKKLCERWLDNLILILFEDLRIFSLYEEELKLKKESGKGVKEWLLLGQLSQRLQHIVQGIIIIFYSLHCRKRQSWLIKSVYLQ